MRVLCQGKIFCPLSRLVTMSAVRDVFDYSLWVDGHFVDIQGCVVRLFVGPVRFVTNIERDVREVYVIVTLLYSYL